MSEPLTVAVTKPDAAAGEALLEQRFPMRGRACFLGKLPGAGDGLFQASSPGPPRLPGLLVGQKRAARTLASGSVVSSGGAWPPTPSLTASEGRRNAREASRWLEVKGEARKPQLLPLWRAAVPGIDWKGV